MITLCKYFLGTYTVSYTPTTTGQQTMDISVNGVSLNGFASKGHVLPDIANASVSFALPDDPIVENSPAKFILTVKDQQGTGISGQSDAIKVIVDTDEVVKITERYIYIDCSK